MIFEYYYPPAKAGGNSKAGATKVRGKSNLKGQRPEIFVAKA